MRRNLEYHAVMFLSMDVKSLLWPLSRIFWSDLNLEEIVNQAFVGVCEVCGEKIFAELHEGMLSLLALKNHSNCKKCRKLLCKYCVKVKRKGLHREYYCPDCML